MFEKIASQVRELRKNQPLRKFKPGSLKIACIGNCVVNKLSYFLRSKGNADSLFFSNLTNWGNYHHESFFERGHEADIIVALMARRGWLHNTEDDLIREFGQKIVFVPLVWIEGLASLQSFGAAGSTKFSGGGSIGRHIQRHGVEDAVRAVTRGMLRTNPTARFQKSLDYIRKIEQGSIKISDFIEDRHRDEPLMNSIGHPTGRLVLEIFSRLCGQLDIKFDKSFLSNPYALSQSSLSGGPRIFSPYDVEELGLKYDHDPDWMLQTKSLLTIMGNQIKTGNFLEELGEADIA